MNLFLFLQFYFYWSTFSSFFLQIMAKNGHLIKYLILTINYWLKITTKKSKSKLCGLLVFFNYKNQQNMATKTKNPHITCII